MNVRLDFNGYADVNVLELRIDAECAHSGADTERRSERTGGNGNSIANIQAGLHTVSSANLRIFQNLGIGIVHQQLGVQRIDTKSIVSRVEMLQVIEVQSGSAAGRGSSGSTTATAPAAAGCGGCVGSLQRYGSVLWREDAHLAHSVAPHLGYDNIDDHFRLGLVDVINHFLCERKLVRSATDDDCVLRRYLLDALHFEDRADGIHHVLKIGGRGYVPEIKSFDDALLEFPALAGV